MELTESIKSINQQLVDLYGIDTISGEPIWRIVFSEEQFEKRLMDVTDSGIILVQPEVRLVPKYRQWIQNKYVLERLVIIPEINSDELPTSRLSYEPIFTFETNSGQYLPPRLDAAKFIIDSVYAAMGKTSLAKYKDPDSTQEDAIQHHKERIDKLQEELFGNETNIGDSLAHNEGVGYTKEN